MGSIQARHGGEIRRAGPLFRHAVHIALQYEKHLGKRSRRVIPVFATEAEEAKWWYKNRSRHGKQLLAAVKNGQAQVLT